VNYVVDGAPWQTMSAGDIDQFVRPNEIVAVEGLSRVANAAAVHGTGPEQLRDDCRVDVGACETTAWRNPDCGIAAD
jgi:hypothetical protein